MNRFYSKYTTIYLHYSLKEYIYVIHALALNCFTASSNSLVIPVPVGTLPLVLLVTVVSGVDSVHPPLAAVIRPEARGLPELEPALGTPATHLGVKHKPSLPDLVNLVLSQHLWLPGGFRSRIVLSHSLWFDFI